MKLNKIITTIITMVFSFVAIGQSPTVCPINAGADQTICVPNCATLTGTFVPTNQTNTYLLSTIPYAPDPFNVGTSLFLSDDGWSQVIPLPFTFCFYGNAYNSCLIGSNGMVSFTLTGAGGYCQWPINTPVPSGANPMNTIMGPWQDLYPPAGGTIKYTTYGTAPCRRFVVSWNQLPMYACTSTLCTQQITIYETTNIIDNFIQTKPTCGWNNGRAIEAIHNINGTLATVVPGRNSPSVWTTINDGKRYTPNGASTTVVGWYLGPILITNNATTVVCPTTTTTYTFQATYTNCNQTTTVVSDQVNVIVSTMIVTASLNTSICLGGCANLNCVAVGTTSYSWVSIPGNINVGNTAAITVCPLVTTTYVVTASSTNCLNTDTVIVTVIPMLTANAGVDDSLCSGACVMLQGSGGVFYSWSPAAAIVGSSTIANPQACPLTTTTFTVTVTDANGCIGTDQVTVFVNPTPTVTATSTALSICTGGSVTLTGGGASTYTWDNNVMDAVSFVPTATTTYMVTGADANGCSNTATITVTVNPLPQVAFTAPTVCIGTTTIFTDLSTISSGNIISWSWNFGNPIVTNDVSSLQNPTYLYTTSGTFNVTLICTSANGCVSLITIPVFVNTLPVANFNAISSCLGTATIFNDLSVPTTGVVTNWVWDFGDGSPISNQQNPSHTYPNDSTFNVSLIVTNTAGCTDTFNLPVTINPSPIVAFSADTFAGCPSLCVNFINQSSIATTGNIVGWSWDFGDNSAISTLQNPSHCYNLNGLFTVTLSATSNGGCITTFVIPNMITVYPSPIASFIATPNPSTILENLISFTDLSTGANTWNWSFGTNLNASTLQNPTYIFQDTGTFIVQLLVANQYGCQDSIDWSIIIRPDYALHIPNAFTPNEDNLNDKFYPLGIGVNPDKYTLYIFDRWGNMIFNTDKVIEGWDGTVQGTGRLCQIDTYVYRVSAMEPEGTVKVYMGVVNLIR